MKEDILFQGERLDKIGFGNLKLIQKPKEFCYGIDAVILAEFAANAIAENNKFKNAIDIGTGTGIIPIILSHKTKLEKIKAIEVQKNSYEIAIRNVHMNQLAERISIINADVSEFGEKFPQLNGTFDLVTMNPPYMIGGTGIVNKNEAKRIARHETTAGLDEFVKVAASLLREKGELFMVHRPARLVDICEVCRKYKLEPKEMRFVSPNKNTKANILLVRSVKFGRPELKLLDPLYVYDDFGEKYTAEIEKIYER